MGAAGPRLRTETFERLREQIATASALCSEAQILELADGLHDAIRRRHAEHPPESREMRAVRERLALSAAWPKWLTATLRDKPSSISA
jgi:hypothetical protein